MNRKRKTTKGRKHVQANKTTEDGIKFASGLEKNMYLELKKQNLFDKYEGETFTLVNSFTFENECYERQANSKGEFRNRNGNVRPITYKPDFTGKDYIIECKGRANASFPIRYKLFKKLLTDSGDTRPVYKPQNKAECEKVATLIKNGRKK